MIRYTTESGAVYLVDTDNKRWQRTGQTDVGLTRPNNVWHEYDQFHEGKALTLGFGEREFRITTDIVSKEVEG